MKTNELKKGMRVKLCNGWYGTMMDNLKGNTRMVDVEGTVRETGSVYAHDIMFYVAAENEHVPVEHTAKQLECKKLNEAFFGR